MKVPGERIKRGLRIIAALAKADVQCAEPNDYSTIERNDLTTAFAWLDHISIAKPLGIK